VLSGITLTIICPTRGLPAPDVTWEMNNTNVRPGGRFVVQEGTLTIRNLVKQDQGNIRCVARNAAGQDTATSKLNVIDGDGEEARITIGQDLRVVEKMNVRIHCPIVGFPKPVVTWTRNNQDVRSNARLFVDPNTNDLLINNILTSDTGQYICSAVNPIGEDEKSSFITVTATIGTTITLLAGAKLVLQCPSTGVPLPSTSWSLNGEPLEKGGRADLRGTELVIPAVAGVDSGKYQCTASNVIALDSRASDVTVRGKYT
ncbi:predicted protein, partial [Nematostella vectensis]